MKFSAQSSAACAFSLTFPPFPVHGVRFIPVQCETLALLVSAAAARATVSSKEPIVLLWFVVCHAGPSP